MKHVADFIKRNWILIGAPVLALVLLGTSISIDQSSTHRNLSTKSDNAQVNEHKPPKVDQARVAPVPVQTGIIKPEPSKPAPKVVDTAKCKAAAKLVLVPKSGEDELRKAALRANYRHAETVRCYEKELAK